MTVFFIFACLLVIAALAAIVPSALRTNDVDSDAGQQELNQLDTNVNIARERRASLQDALENGTIDQATFDTEINDLANALAVDLEAQRGKQESSRSALVVAGLIALFLPVASGALYLHLGTPGGVNTSAMHQQALAEQQKTQSEAPPALTELLPNLEKKLEANPDDRDGWKLLGKSYLSLGEFGNAKRALLKAYELDKNDPDLLSQLAETSAMEREGDLSGEASEYLDAALTINPGHQQSLWLKAIADQQAGNHETAIERFEALRASVPGNTEAQTSIDELIAQSKDALSIVDLTAPKTEAPEKNESSEQSDSTNTTNSSATADASKTESGSETDNAANTTASLTVTVDLAEHVKAEVSPNDAVFIFARASSGPPMPLAVSRHTVSELPVNVILDDGMAMLPNMTLSQFPNVTVGARVSKSGNAIAQPGDWFTEATNVNVTNAPELTLIIDQQK